MKNLKLLPLIFITLFIFNLSCNKDDEPVKEEEQKDSNLAEIDLQILLPEGSGIEFSNIQLTSFAESYIIDQNGLSKVLINKEGKSFVYVSDSDNNIILMGFVSRENPVLNLSSTLESSLYFGFGTIFQLPEVKNKFLNEFQSLSEIQPFVEELEIMHKSNPLLLKSQSYQLWINDVAKELTKGREIVNANKVLVKDGKEKSGIKVTQDESDLFSVSILNFRRRRARAFLYKTHVKKEGQTDYEELLNPKTIGSSKSLKANLEMQITPITGVNSVQGSLFDFAIGNGQNLGFTKNGPSKLELANDLTASKYTVRIIGPGGESLIHATQEELSALNKMKLETLLLDYVIPIITTAVSIADIKDIKNGFEITTLMEAGNTALAASPNALNAYINGDYKTAAVEFVKALATGAIGTEAFWGVIKSILVKAGWSSLESVEDLAGKMAAPLTIANGIVLASDLAIIAYDVSTARELELFDLIVSRGNVRIDPHITAISLGEEVSLNAKVIDDEDIQEGEYLYKWNTSGKFGKFKNNSETDEIIYKSDGNIELPPNAQENIYVEVFKDGNLIGKDSSVVNIYLGKYRIIPDGVTINGDQSLKLDIVDIKNEPINLVSLDGYYRVEWSTPGIYGSFEGSLKNVESIDNSPVIYQAFDTKALNASEIIEAKIYFSTESDRSDESLIQEITATINIDNDPKKKYSVLGAEYWLHDSFPEGNGTREIYYMGYLIPHNEDAVSYQLKINDIVHAGYPFYQNITFSWTNESPPNTYISYNDEANEHRVTLLGNSTNTINEPRYSINYNNTVNVSGTAQLTITLKDD